MIQLLDCSVFLVLSVMYCIGARTKYTEFNYSVYNLLCLSLYFSDSLQTCAHYFARRCS